MEVIKSKNNTAQKRTIMLISNLVPDTNSNPKRWTGNKLKAQDSSSIASVASSGKKECWA